jgi:hypothetical protein
MNPRLGSLRRVDNSTTKEKLQFVSFVQKKKNMKGVRLVEVFDEGSLNPVAHSTSFFNPESNFSLNSVSTASSV